MPKITVLLITVRDHGYVKYPEWDTIGKVVHDLERQTFKDFELVVIDGVPRETAKHGWQCDGFYTVRCGPRDTYWTRHKKVAICAYRNTGLIHARGELVVNLDDCCELPVDYLETFWTAYQNGVCLASRWPEQGDSRSDGPAQEGSVYGFGSYPLETALAINGYDEAFDGSQGLEDVDFSTRLQQAGVSMYLFGLKGFRIHDQSKWDPRAIDDEPLVKCCNTAWRATRKLPGVKRNVATQWTPEFFNEICATPCPLIYARKGAFDTAEWGCLHHGLPCAYLNKEWPHVKPHPLWKAFVEEPSNWPVFSLRALRRCR